MKIAGLEINPKQLLSKQELLRYLEQNGANDRVLADIKNEYFEKFGNELVWHYPISDGLHSGVFIACVQEGYLSLPYDEIVPFDHEIIKLDKCALHDADSLTAFIEDWQSFADDLLGAMNDMRTILSEELTNKKE